MAGERIPYFTVEKGDRYYAKRGLWTSKDYDAAFMTQELAERIQKRYPGSIVVRNFGYDLNFKISFEDVGEPESTTALVDAVKLPDATRVCHSTSRC